MKDRLVQGAEGEKPERANQPLDAWVFWACAGLALSLHAVLLLRADGLRAGGDMVPHLGLIALMRESPAIRSIYPPAYHAIGALLSPVVGLGAYPRWFAFASAAALIFAFRFFARGARLPAAASAVFALSPYPLSLSWCIPKVEFMGLAVALLGLGFLVRRRSVGVALAVVGVFLVHTAAGLVYGLAAGVLALAARDLRGLAALAAGSLLVLPWFALHLDAGCSVAQAFQFSKSAYLEQSTLIPENWPNVLMLASPIAIVAAVLGAGATWRHSRPLAVACGALALLYLSPVWLAPFGMKTSVDLWRGLSIFAIPVAVAAGFGVGQRRWLVLTVLAACGLWCTISAFTAVPGSCYTRPIELTEIRGIEVRRCEWMWRTADHPRRPREKPSEVRIRRRPG